MNKMLREMQVRLAKVQEELASERLEVTAGGGAVAVVIDGQQRLHAVKLAPEAVDPDDVGLLEDLLVTAFNDAVTKSQELAQRKLGALTGGLKLPGL
ncbi:MAG: YbaB/EbfC family nucleoid-associated protein [Chloroflexi bacterium]|nr:YbaB/EbfC family nucleoid-associated protein [Chloroflexota bacterium]